MTPMTGHTDISRYLLAGNATLTLRSMRTQTRYTVKVQKSEPNEQYRRRADVLDSYFVKLLVAPDEYQYLGMLERRVEGVALRLTKGSKMNDGSGPVAAVNWFLKQVINQDTPPALAQLEVWHEGQCGRCGRELTVPESIARGIGPECWEKMGGFL